MFGGATAAGMLGARLARRLVVGTGGVAVFQSLEKLTAEDWKDAVTRSKPQV
jgi:hypothetical protein